MADDLEQGKYCRGSWQSAVLQGEAIFQKQFEQQREQPRPDIRRNGEMLAPLNRQFEGALRQQHGPGRIAGEAGGELEQLQIVYLEEAFNSGAVGHSHHRLVS